MELRSYRSYLGHYFEDHYAAAKEDFAIRSWLIEKEKFLIEQMKEIHRCVSGYLASGMKLFQSCQKPLESVISQIEEVIPDQIGQTEQFSGMEMK